MFRVILKTSRTVPISESGYRKASVTLMIPAPRIISLPYLLLFTVCAFGQNTPAAPAKSDKAAAYYNYSLGIFTPNSRPHTAIEGITSIKP